jgi:EAL domain-containing protein (putative c-di-GMP-specific phosphodiesterase class I)/ActR/RegA family two-component response regulator
VADRPRRSPNVTADILARDARDVMSLPIRVLLVDDEPLILRSFARALDRAGIGNVSVGNGADALQALEQSDFDVIISDISMPLMSGVELLAAIRRTDPDVPVVLVTGTPTVESAVRAVELGALRYLTKPVAEAELVEVATTAGRLSRLARLKRAALAESGDAGVPGDRHALAVRFAVALEKLWIAYQPIVSWSERKVVGYEALVRSDEPLMRSPIELLGAAERLDRIHHLGRRIRACAVAGAGTMPPECLLFLNLHPKDLTDAELLEPGTPLGGFAGRVVLEITERRALDGMDLGQLAPALRRFGYRLAIDDLGAGYAGLTSFAQLDPAVAKLDMTLVRDIDRSPVKRRIVEGMVKVCLDLGVRAIVEGVETEAERDVLVEIGCDWMQGYLFARPGRGLPTWPPPPA